MREGISPKKMDVVVLAAGRSRRFRMQKPKVVQEVCGRPLLYYLLKTLQKKKYTSQITLVVGHKAEAVKSALSVYFGNLRFAYQPSLNGSGGAVAAARGVLSRRPADVMVLCGDTLLLDESVVGRLWRLHCQSRSHATFVSCRHARPQDLGRVVFSSGGEFDSIKEAGDLRKEERLIKDVNCGIYIFKKQYLFENLRRLKKNARRGEYFLTDVLALMRKRGLKISVLRLKDCGGLLMINRQKELASAEYALRQKTLERLMRKGVRIIDPPTTFIYPEAAVGRETVIYPFTFIENNVKIGRHCRIGPFAHLRPFTRIGEGAEIGNFAEAVRSYLGRGVRMKHFSYSGDAHIESGVNIGAGCVIANYDGRRKHKSHIGKGAFLGSNSTLVAPVKIGRGGVTGAGSVVKKAVPAHAVVVGVPAKILRRKR